MRFRKLRIVFSTASTLVALLLVTMWLGSYGKNHRPLRVGDVGFWSEHGVVTLVSPAGIRADPDEQKLIARYESLLPMPEPVELDWTVDVLGLHFFGPGSVWILDVPYWMLVVPMGALAAAPWIICLRRYSLRSLLVAITLVALLLGLAAYGFKH